MSARTVPCDVINVETRVEPSFLNLTGSIYVASNIFKA